MSYQQELPEMIKAVGQELMDRAEDLAGKGDTISDVTIWIRFPQNGDIPTIEVQREHISKRCLELFLKKQDGRQMKSGDA